jgi:hypothetical protein
VWFAWLFFACPYGLVWTAESQETYLVAALPTVSGGQRDQLRPFGAVGSASQGAGSANVPQRPSSARLLYMHG